MSHRFTESNYSSCSHVMENCQTEHRIRCKSQHVGAVYYSILTIYNTLSAARAFLEHVNPPHTILNVCVEQNQLHRSKLVKMTVVYCLHVEYGVQFSLFVESLLKWSPCGKLQNERICHEGSPPDSLKLILKFYSFWVSVVALRTHIVHQSG